ncbi:hypothetical protein EJ03DRAFT_65435 [Teratosphaeria nubilosa]|uniref:Uncharacterized protein n=1 Tax=Teratosphaeria nubilosa TaxID=161662 RepID=A0A6G1LCG1_9PEZI|nr:hypothetical protein EJ03DRAFT_65435 [Teratosphaeria nubilosa]
MKGYTSSHMPLDGSGSGSSSSSGLASFCSSGLSSSQSPSSTSAPGSSSSGLQATPLSSASRIQLFNIIFIQLIRRHIFSGFHVFKPGIFDTSKLNASKPHASREQCAAQSQELQRHRV